VPLPCLVQGNLLGAIGAGNQDATSLQPPPQVEQKAGGGRIDPLQFVQDEQQGVLLGQCPQQVSDLLEEGGLLHVLSTCGPAFYALSQVPEPWLTGRRRSLGQGQQRRTGQQRGNHVGTMLHQRLDRQGHGLPQAQCVITTHGSRSPLGFHVARQHA
jgi:hypothetical protein